jgi:RNA polymerase sigma-70 factor, ECF subfamily
MGAAAIDVDIGPRLTRLIRADSVSSMSAPSATSLVSATDAEVATTIASQPAGHASAAEAELYRRFAPRVRLFGLKHLRDEAAAQDLAQQVLLMTIERLRAGEVQDAEQIGSFILGASRLSCGGIRRTERRRVDLHARFDVPAVTDDPNETDLFALEAVARCLAGVGPRERAILVQTYYAEKSAPEIAAALGMTAGAVRVARHRALESMRQCVESRRLA